MTKTEIAVQSLAQRYRFACPLVIPLKTTDGRPIKPPFIPRPNRKGYPVFSVRMRKLGISMQIHVHQVVAYQKFGADIFQPRIVVRHKDNNKMNFLHENILIGTHKDNYNDNPDELKEKLKQVARVAAIKRKMNVGSPTAPLLKEAYREVSSAAGASSAT